MWKTDHAGPPGEVKVRFTEAVILTLRSQGWMRRRKFRQRGYPGLQDEKPGRAGERWMWFQTPKAVYSWRHWLVYWKSVNLSCSWWEATDGFQAEKRQGEVCTLTKLSLGPVKTVVGGGGSMTGCLVNSAGKKCWGLNQSLDCGNEEDGSDRWGLGDPCYLDFWIMSLPGKLTVIIMLSFH